MHTNMFVPADEVLVEEVTVLLLLLQNTAVMPITQLLPGVADTVCVVTDPLTVTVWFVTDELQMS